MKLRAGSKVKRTLYLVENDPMESDRLIGLVDTPELAQAIVERANLYGALSESLQKCEAKSQRYRRALVEICAIADCAMARSIAEHALHGEVAL